MKKFIKEINQSGVVKVRVKLHYSDSHYAAIMIDTKKLLTLHFKSDDLTPIPASDWSEVKFMTVKNSLKKSVENDLAIPAAHVHFCLLDEENVGRGLHCIPKVIQRLTKYPKATPQYFASIPNYIDDILMLNELGVKRIPIIADKKNIGLLMIETDANYI
jgi:hypothetical protein